MKAKEIKPGVYWVGAIDWNLRNFHGYSTEMGSTYNAYLIIDEKVTLVDTVKHTLCDEMITRIKSVIDPAKIDYIISNHTEMDHSGSVEDMVRLAPNATVIASANGVKGLKRHFGDHWHFQTVKPKEEISIGKNTLQFFPIPMVHWPDSMATYVTELKLLLPNDAFGQHLASEYLYDDETGWELVKHQATKYYANIVLPYGKSVQNALKALGGLDIDMIGPSHGVILRSHIKDMMELYQKWSTHQSDNKAVVIYDSMWHSTETMARQIQYQMDQKDIPVKLISLSHSHISDAMTDIMDARYVFLGSPTLNNDMLPTMGAMLTYIRGLRPQNKKCFLFGSYGWNGQSIKRMEEFVTEFGWEMPTTPYKVQYIPKEEDLEELKKAVQEFLG